MARRTNKEELPKVDIVLTADEMNTLNGEPAELWKLYIELNRRRDFTTNIAGQKTKISDRAFKEMTEVTKKQGREPKKPTTKHITRWLSQLEALGMIKPLGNYVFKLQKAATHETVQKKCHQSVTKSVTTSVTNSDNTNTPIKTDENSNSKNEVSPQVSPQVSTRLGIPLNTLHNITYPSAQNFFDLLYQQKYTLSQVQSNKNVVAMVHAWVKAEVSLEEAQIGINHVNARLGTPPNTPSYYLKPVLQVRKDLEKAQQQAEEISNATQNPTSRTIRTDYPRRVTQTQSFYEECLPALHRNRHKKQDDS